MLDGLTKPSALPFGSGSSEPSKLSSFTNMFGFNKPETQKQLSSTDKAIGAIGDKLKELMEFAK